MRDPIRHLKALAFALTVFLVTSFAGAQVRPQLFPFMPYVWPYIAGGSLTYTGTDLASAPAPSFALQNQRGEQVSLDDLRGKLVVLTFFDPLCTDDCPLMVQELAAAYAQLGADAHEVVIVAINVNPDAQTQFEMDSFFRTQGLEENSAWHFLGGEWAEVAEIVAAYHVSAGDPKPSKPGEVAHQDVVFLIDRQGNYRVLITYPTPVGATLRDVIVRRVRQLL